MVTVVQCFVSIMLVFCVVVIYDWRVGLVMCYFV